MRKIYISIVNLSCCGHNTTAPQRQHNNNTTH